MANRRLPMRKIKEVLRLKYECGISEREIARICTMVRGSKKSISWKMNEVVHIWQDSISVNVRL
jgi:hypothetical protein